MKTKKVATNRPLIRIVVVATIIVMLLITAIIYMQSRTNNSSASQSSQSQINTPIDNGAPTNDQKKAGEDIKAASQTPISTAVSTIITSKNVTTDMLQIRSITNGAVSNDGTCNLTLTNSNVTISKTSPTYAMPSASTCKGFDISRAELTSGTWYINLDVIIGDEKSNTTDSIILD